MGPWLNCCLQPNALVEPEWSAFYEFRADCGQLGPLTILRLETAGGKSLKGVTPQFC